MRTGLAVASVARWKMAAIAEREMMFKGTNGEGWEDVEATTTRKKRRLPKPKRPVELEIDDIALGNGGRKVDDRKVKQLEKSIADQGLLTPIQVYKLGNIHKDKFGLAAGKHRLRALTNLGYTSVSAVVITRKQAKAWRSSENLHRNGLRTLERSEDIVNYAKQRQQLRNVKGTEETKGGRQPHDRGYKKLAEATGFDRKRIAEAYLHCSLPDRVKKLIRRRPKCNNRKTLNAVARMPAEEDQLAYMRNHARVGLGGKRPRSGKDGRKSNDGLSEALRELDAAWNASKFRKLFNKHSKSVQKKFIKQFLS
jgi:ParB family transcriptional regulator, chromosome partitioning protein